MSNQGFLFISPDDMMETGEPHWSRVPSICEGRFRDSFRPGIVGQGQRNFHNRLPRLPLFIRSDPSLWFAQVELVFESSCNFSQRMKAGAVVAALDHEVIQTCGDLLIKNSHIEN